MASALILLAPGFEEIEAITVIDLLRRAGVAVTVAGLRKELVRGSHKISVKPDIYYKDVSQEAFDILILPGGQPGSNNLKADPAILEWIRKRFAGGRKLAAICAAPTVFQAAGITGNLKITSYPSEREVFDESIYLEDKVVNDHNIITSRGVGTAIDFALELIAQLEGTEKAREVRQKILF